MQKIWKAVRPALYCFLIMTLICGVIYTAAVTFAAQVFFKHKANGSIVSVSTTAGGQKKEVGSSLIGQKFTSPKYLIGRPMEVSYLSPAGKEQKNRVAERVDWWHRFNDDKETPVPSDLVTSSASGVDAYISPEAAEYQIRRIASERGMTEDYVRVLVKRFTAGRILGFWGESRVNVLMVNLALDGLI